MLLFTLFAASLAGPPGGAATSSYAAELFPHQVWPQLEAHTTGLLVQAGSHAWGTPIQWGGGPDKPNYCAYRYFTGDGSPFALYFEVNDPTAGYNYLANWSGGGAFTPHDATMLCAKNGGGYGLESEIHVVRLEVNSGEGGGRNLHFVATGVEVLDGTKAVPLDPEAAMVELRKRFDGGLKDRRRRIEGLIGTGREAAEGASSGFEGGPVTAHDLQESVRVKPSWRPESSELIATFVWSRSGQLQASYTTMQEYHCPPGAPCLPPRREEVTEVWAYGAEVAATFVVSAKGRVLSEQWHEPRGMGLSGS